MYIYNCGCKITKYIVNMIAKQLSFFVPLHLWITTYNTTNRNK